MTLVDDPLVASEPPTMPSTPLPRASASSWRLAMRLARRETRRRPGRTVLAASLIAVPVFAMTLGSIVVRTDTDDVATQLERDYAGVDVVVNPGSFGYVTDAAVEAPAVEPPAGTVVDDYIWMSTPITASAPRADGGSQLWVTFTDVGLVGDGSGQPIEVLAGRAPADGEVLLDAGSAEALGVEIGDRVVLDRPAGSWTLTGIGRLRAYHGSQLFVVPGFDRDRLAADAVQTTTTYRLPDGTSEREIREFATAVGGVTAADDRYSYVDDVRGAIAWGWVGGVLALVAVGIVVAAAFATSARRQLVTIGQLTSNGATRSIVTRTLALQGTWTGLIGSFVGIALGLAALPVARPWVERFLGHDLPAYSIGWTDLVVTFVTATAAATIAAAVPARSSARIPVMAALAGRRPVGRIPRWQVPVGLALLGGGLGLMALSAIAARNATSTDVFALLIVIGVVAVVFGMCCATPIVVVSVGALGRSATLSWRVALRSMARSRSRSSAVIAAIAVAVGGAVAAAAVVEQTMAETRASWTASLPDDTVVAQLWDQPVAIAEAGSSVVDPPQPESAPVPAGLLRDLSAVSDVAAVTPTRHAVYDPVAYDQLTTAPTFASGRGPLVVDDAVARAMGIHPDDLATLQRVGSLRPVARFGHVYLTGDAGLVETSTSGSGDAEPAPIVYETESGPIEVPAPIAEHPPQFDYWTYGAVLITEQAADELGFDLAETGAIVRYDAPLTPAERSEIVDIQNRLSGGAMSDAFVEPGDPPRPDADSPPPPASEWGVTYDDPTWRDQGADLWVARAIVVGAALVLTLLVVSIGLALAAAEGREERVTLAVVGATPATMRRQAAATAVVLATTGIALGVPTGFVPAWVLYRIGNANDWFGDSLAVPWLVVGALLTLVPVVVASVAWAATGVGQRLRPIRVSRRD